MVAQFGKRTGGASSAIQYFLEGEEINPLEFITPTFKCNANILHAGGQINAYLVNLTAAVTLEKEVTGKISYNDVLQVFSPVATILQIPVHASASVVSIQTFCDPDDSEAKAMASVSVTLGGSTATVSKSSIVKGAFLDNYSVNETKYAAVSVPAGVSTIPFTVSGELMAKSRVKGLSDDFPIACGSNAVASAGNSLTVGLFTGPNGQALPNGIKIFGLLTGINYTDVQNGTVCPNLPVAQIATTDASCGKANGSATITVTGVNNPVIEWSNGQSGLSATGFGKGDHYAIVTDVDDCSAIFPFTINDNNIPGVNLPETIKIVPGQTITLNATDTTGGIYNYSWSNGATTSAIEINSPGEYRVTLSNSLGCQFIYSTLALDQEGFFISDGNIKVDFGLFFDDGGPNMNYTPNQTHVITICPDTPDKFIQLDFTEVDILNTNDQDELSIFDGLGSICPLSTNLKSPQVFTASISSGGCLTVRFRATDYDAEGKGWKALIKTTYDAPEGCYVDTVSCGEVFTDPSGPNSDYEPNQYKVYYLCSDQPGESLKLDFTEVEIGLGDHLAVYDGRGVYCLWEDSLFAAPQTFISSTKSGGCLTVVFDSDNTGQKKGWKANVSCVTSTTPAPEYCICGNNPDPSDGCTDAPFFNNLESFCGESSIFYAADVYGDLETDFTCGVIHNNSFVKFISNSTSVKLGYKVRGGTHKLCSGFQLAVFRVNGDCSTSTANWTQVKCLNIDNGLKGEGEFDITGLVVGQTYYLMIDGSYGSECLYALFPKNGFATCPLNLSSEEILCNSDGSYSVKIPIVGVGNNLEYDVFEAYNYFNEIDSIKFKDDGSSNSITIGPYPPGRPYKIVVYGGQGLSNCNLTIEGEPHCNVPCDIEVEFLTQCQSGHLSIDGKINSGTLPMSIHSELFTRIIYPSSSNTFEIDLPGNLEERTIRVYLADFNLCKKEQNIVVPRCINCSDDLNLWPNPVHDKLFFSTYNCVVWDVSIYDCSGRLIFTPKLTYDSNQEAFDLDTKSLPSGLYFIRLRNQETYITRKFIKI